MNLKKQLSMTLISVLYALSGYAHAAIALDRTRIVFNGDASSMSVNIQNHNKQLPYLAQAWAEDAQGKKITSPLTILPPLQRVEPGAKSQVKLQLTNEAARGLPQDRESLFFFNLREIPPKSNKPNTLQIALQTKIKIFYRPKAIVIKDYGDPFQKGITIERKENKLVVNNPTPYNVTIAYASNSEKGKALGGFEPIMIAPKSSADYKGDEKALGSTPVLTYINDFGGRPKLVFGCSGSQCKVTSNING